ncbi:MAG: AAA family ATPase [Candidatus Omnitrophota bacterium]|nr:AAA family ATPase [Candidatus Omnitrophota bacterium]MBU1929513.1 AAA family ATPase [Candidatus Omnitrophota bacterium]MBU2035310.1 AAA family ATPase [Candidatus Omnitrophota bacterium]MBU2221908.1 AAA family ATPase [Candidatus Omnitrophota bacterium]MBU2258458.1 AAA family ATPase [Candidatus Omnitrophota bacterium]
MNWRKTKVFFKLHWLGISGIIVVTAIAISFAYFISSAVNAWITSESYFKKALLAQNAIFFYIFLVLNLISLPLSGLLWIWVMRGGHMKFSHIGKKAVKGKEIKIHWQDVIGMEEAKEEALEVVRLVTDRAKLQAIGGQILRGILMIGPPGCGKTYLAKAIATEANMPFISMSGSEFIEMFVGVGASRIRKLFKQARQLAYTDGGCIIFIDELDAVGAQRSVDRGFGGQTESNTTLNQLLIEMDGLKEKDQNVIIIGATNAPEGFLDPALIRPGRFDRKIYVNQPNLEDREKLFEYYMKEVKCDDTVDRQRMARLTVGNSPADISNLIREAALIAVRNRKELISMKEISEAYDRVEMGIKHKIVFTQSDREKIAYHEAGHAIAMYFLAPHKDVFKATILARGGALGFVMPHPREEIHVRTKDQYLGDIKVSLGSYAAEKLKLKITTSGVSQDFTTAMWIAHQMVWNWGMGNSGLVGNYGLLASMNQVMGVFKGENVSYISEKLKEQLNNDVQQIIDECLKEVEVLLKQESALLERFAKELLAKDELNYDEIEAIFKEFHKARPSI